MPTPPFPTPTLAGAGSWINTLSANVAGSLGSMTVFSHVPQALNNVIRVTVSSSLATLPTMTISDVDGSTFNLVTGSNNPGEAQYTFTSISARAVGGNHITVVFPNAIHKAVSPMITVDYFNKAGS